MPSHRRIVLAFLATLALLGGANTAAAQSSDLPKPDPAPAAVQHQQSTSTPAATTGSSSSSSSHSTPSPSPAPTAAPEPVVTPTPSSSSEPTQSSSSPAKAAATKHQVNRAAKAKAAKAKAAKAAKAKAAKAKRAAIQAKKPVVLGPVVRSTPAHPFTPPVSGLSRSDRRVLLVTYLLGIGVGVGVFVLLARAGWRWYSWGRWRYREFDSSPRRPRDVKMISRNVHALVDAERQDSGDDAEAVTAAPRSGADAPTGT